MTTNIFTGKKFYAMCRMRLAIDRAIQAKTALEKERSARWAAAWGTAAGIPPAVQQGSQRRAIHSDKVRSPTPG